MVEQFNLNSTQGTSTLKLLNEKSVETFISKSPGIKMDACFAFSKALEFLLSIASLIIH